MIRKTLSSLAFATLFAIVAAQQTQAGNLLTNEQKLSDLNQLAARMKSGYGPLRYKKDKLNLDVDVIEAVYMGRIANTKTDAEFYYEIIKFIAEFRDGHFRATLPTNLKASVPFDTDLVTGKVLIDTINRKELSETDFPFQKGDEILAVNGQPISEVLSELKSYRGLGNPKAELRYAAMSVTVRDGKRIPVPKGEVVFKIRRGTSTNIQEAKLKWKVDGTPIDEINESDLFSPALKLNGESFSRGPFDELSIFSLNDEISNPQTEKSFRCSGTSRIQMPEGATTIMKDPFLAYYYPTEKGNIGYLRLPHYYPTDKDYDKAFAQYEYAVSELEKNTVGLVIDQDHNCGGSVSYLHRILSLFMNEPFKPMQFQLLANKEEYLEFVEWLKEVPENTIAHKNISKVKEIVKKAWFDGQYMTERTSLDGEEIIQPNTVRYTKPIVVLIDENSGSGGDAFPSLIQGYGRAKLIGSQTMGLGGHVTTQATLFYSQIVPEMTKSLFFRPDGVPVENNGASPDFEYDITRDDFVYGYTDYRKFYESKLFEMLK